MNDVSPDTACQRRNAVLGLALGGWCLALIVLCIILFSKYGFPKDPNAVRAGQDTAGSAPQVPHE